jgi:tetratricopeptide (TPR) repeat protein
VQQRLPLNLNVNLDTAALFLAAGRYDQAIEQSQKALELDPNFWWTYQALVMTYERKQRYEEAVAALEKASQAHRNPSGLGYLGYVCAAAGKRAEANRSNILSAPREAAFKDMAFIASFLLSDRHRQKVISPRQSDVALFQFERGMKWVASLQFSMRNIYPAYHRGPISSTRPGASLMSQS